MIDRRRADRFGDSRLVIGAVSISGGDAWRRYGGTLALSAATALVAFPLQQLFDVSNIVMLFLLAVVGTAMLFGRGPAVLAAIVNVLVFDFFFVPPRFTFAVADAQYLFTFAVMLVVGVVVGQLTAQLRHQASVARQGEERARRLFEMARELSAALGREQIAEIGERFAATVARGNATTLVLDDDDRTLLAASAAKRACIDMAIARSCIDRAATSGDAIAAAGKLYLPLRAPMRTRGVLVVEALDAAQLDDPSQRRLLETCAALVAIGLERVHFISVAQRTSIDIESERLRNSVLSALSHDLRTPLTALVGLSETLAHELAREPNPVDGEAKALAIREQARRTAQLVDNLLEMARLEAGRVNIRRDWQSVEELVGSAIAMLDPALARREVDLYIPADLPLVACDGALIERVLFNLIENATKYTPDGTPIRIGARRVDGVVEVAVEDRGPGLPQGRERAIFDKFTRGEKESVVPGVGLGLAICRAIVEAHGGTITAQARDGGGARFVFTLPAAEQPAPPPEAEASATA
jgi:two-component system sensor histidine kinase KdpD